MFRKQKKPPVNVVNIILHLNVQIQETMAKIREAESHRTDPAYLAYLKGYHEGLENFRLCIESQFEYRGINLE